LHNDAETAEHRHSIKPNPDESTGGEDWPRRSRMRRGRAGVAAEDLLLHPERIETNVRDGQDRRQIEARARPFFQTATSARNVVCLLVRRWREAAEPALWR
jgi:hypothetical protein